MKAIDDRLREHMERIKDAMDHDACTLEMLEKLKTLAEMKRYADASGKPFPPSQTH